MKDLVAHTLKSSGLIEHHKKEPGEKGKTRVENLAELVSAAGEFFPVEEEDEAPLLKKFIDHAALDAGEGQAEDHESAVQLMTLHSAKGLEFSLVFITGFEEGLFPHHRILVDTNSLKKIRLEERARSI